LRNSVRNGPSRDPSPAAEQGRRAARGLRPFLFLLSSYRPKPHSNANAFWPTAPGVRLSFFAICGPLISTAHVYI